MAAAKTTPERAENPRGAGGVHGWTYRMQARISRKLLDRFERLLETRRRARGLITNMRAGCGDCYPRHPLF
jgi:hypothetical protein